MKHIQRLFAIIAVICVVLSIGTAGTIERGGSISENAPTAFYYMIGGLTAGTIANKIEEAKKQ